jgi:apolipoprotein N-acyltransferase
MTETPSPPPGDIPPPRGYGYPSVPPNPPGFGYGYPGAMPPEHPRATTILTLGIVSLVVTFIGIFCCTLLGLIGLVPLILGRKAEREILASNGALGGASTVRSGWIMGAIAVGLSVFAFVATFAAFAVLEISGVLE